MHRIAIDAILMELFLELLLINLIIIFAVSFHSRKGANQSKTVASYGNLFVL